MSSTSRYTRLAMFFHWLIAALIAANVLLVWTVDYMPKTLQRPMIDTHKSFGLTVLGLAILRLLWRYVNPPPAMPRSYKKWERISAHTAHWILYGLIFLMPLSGWFHDSAWKDAAGHPLVLYGFIPWFRIGTITDQDPAVKEHLHDLFGAVHSSLAFVLYAMVTVHVLGALKHQFLDKVPELQRMLPGE